ncbi:RNA-binding ATPase activator esf2 [Acarospora aff. strigata]|nr:RNA-binding ATPase activator esf2 [Acarospora aff. strigata]
MSTRKWNKYLEDNPSDGENDQGYDSEAVEERKGSRLVALSTSRKSKRRRVNIETEDLVGDVEQTHESDLSEDEGPAEEPPAAEETAGGDVIPAKDAGNMKPSSASRTVPSETSRSNPKPLSTKQLESTARAARKTGVIYLSRIPPFMKPQTVRHLLSPFGTVTKIFLTPESPAAHSQRTKSGGNKKRSFVDGWVEFSSKKDAKLCAETLNTQIVGGKKGGWYHDDVWNIKYLKGFKWHHLTEQIANENAERAARLRADISRVNRENKHFVENVERAKMLEGMEEKRKKKREREDTIGDGDEPKGGVEMGSQQGKGKGTYARHFRQNEVKLTTVKEGVGVEQSAEVKRVLSKIF